MATLQRNLAMKHFWNFLYNIDRALASLFGAPPQETISSRAGRYDNDNNLADKACDILDVIDPGHCEDAVKHADALNKVDDGVTK
jgi:hypothetical protein